MSFQTISNKRLVCVGQATSGLLLQKWNLMLLSCARDHGCPLDCREGLQEFKRRRLGRLPLYLVPVTPAVLNSGAIATEPFGQAPTLAFGVASYCPVRRAPLPRQVRVPIGVSVVAVGIGN